MNEKNRDKKGRFKKIFVSNYWVLDEKYKYPQWHKGFSGEIFKIYQPKIKEVTEFYASR